VKVVIMAGGKGSRISSFAPGIPKPMIPLHGKPVLQHQLECFAKNNLTDILITVGYLGQKIKDYFGNGDKFGCRISYFEEEEPLGSGGALFKIIDKLDDNFIVVNGDIIFDVDFARLIDSHTRSGAWATLVAHPNSHPFDSALLVTDSQYRVTQWLNKEDTREYYKNQVNAGIHVLSKKLLDSVKLQSQKVDLDREIIKPCIGTGKIFAYCTPEYIKDMGTPERCMQVTADIESGLVQRKSLKAKQKAVFLDRDGTINTFNGFVKSPQDFELIDGVANAIKKINALGFLAIVITNQPVIARGEVDFETLDVIHKKMETMLGECGAYIDDLFFCPHHPDKGFAGERVQYKIECNCRKPKPGMLLAAIEKYNIDPSCSYMVGDDMRDVEAGIAAGCIPVLLANNSQTANATIENKQAMLQFQNLAEFAEVCL